MGIVRENIEFKRGLDPKKSLRIGIENIDNPSQIDFFKLRGGLYMLSVYLDLSDGKKDQFKSYAICEITSEKYIKEWTLEIAGRWQPTIDDAKKEWLKKNRKNFWSVKAFVTSDWWDIVNIKSILEEDIK